MDVSLDADFQKTYEKFYRLGRRSHEMRQDYFSFILDDEDNGSGSSCRKPNGNSSTSLVLMVGIPTHSIELFR